MESNRLYIQMPKSTLLDSARHFLRRFTGGKNVSIQQRCQPTEFDRIPLIWEKDKQKEIDQIFLQSKFPFMSDHRKLAQRIAKQLQKMCKGATRRCVQCQCESGWFQYHSFCLKRSDSAPTCSSLIPDMIQKKIGQADLIPDPCITSDSTKIIDSNPRVWSPFIMRLYRRAVDWLLHRRQEYFLNCRRFADWHDLTIPAESFGSMLEVELRETLTSEEAPTRNDYLQNAFQIASGMFVLDMNEVDKWKETSADEDMDMNEEDANVCVYFKACFDEDLMSSNQDFVDFWMNHYHLFAYEKFDWLT